MDNYHKENYAGLACRVEIFRGEFVKKKCGIPAIAHASVSPGCIILLMCDVEKVTREVYFPTFNLKPLAFLL